MFIFILLNCFSLFIKDSVGSMGLAVSLDGTTPLLELPTCPVCLEKLDSTVSGMV